MPVENSRNSLEGAYKRFLEEFKKEILDKNRFSKRQMHNLWQNKVELFSGLDNLIKIWSLNNFTNCIKKVSTQVAIYRKYFPELKHATYDESVLTQPLPIGADGWLAIPKWGKVGSTYSSAVNKLFQTIQSKHLFNCCGDGNFFWRSLDAEHFRQVENTTQAEQEICGNQKEHDIFIIPYKVNSPAHLVDKDISNLWFHLGVFAIGCIILTLTKKEVQWEYISVGCVGDEYNYNNEDWYSSLGFIFDNGAIKFDDLSFPIVAEHYWDFEVLSINF